MQRRLHEPLRLRRTDSTRIAAIERSCRRYERSVRDAAAELGLEAPAVITAHPLMAGFGRFDWAGPVTYYANDDLTAYPPLQPWWPAYEESFARMREAGRRAVGLTPKSLASVEPERPGGAIVPSGVDPGGVDCNRARPPRWFLDLPAPRMVYVGTLDERIDIEIDPQPCRGPSRRARSCWSAARATSARSRRLGAPANVHLRPPIAARRAGRAGRRGGSSGSFPHVRTEQTEAMSPLKLFEYLGARHSRRRDRPARHRLRLSRARRPRRRQPGLPRRRPTALAMGRWGEHAGSTSSPRTPGASRFEALLDLALPDQPMVEDLNLKSRLRLTPEAPNMAVFHPIEKV